MARKQTKKRVVKKAAAKKSTALVPVRRDAMTLSMIDPKGLISQPPLSVSRQIGQGVSLLGELGLVDAKFTKQEIAVINRRVDPSSIRWKPQKKGPAIPYLPHIEYTRWLNEAFGHGGWNLVPSDLPKKTGNTVSREYVLFVHGRPVGFAVGEQDYFENNSQQTYGDALEATMSSALRRVTKHLGFGLELWDKEWIDDLRRKNGIRGSQQDGDEAQPSRRQEQARPPVASRHAHDLEPIAPAQYTRLLEIIKKAGRTKSEVMAHLGVETWEQVKAIKRSDYDALCAAIEKRGALPDKDTQVRTPEVLEAEDIPWGMQGGDR